MSENSSRPVVEAHEEGEDRDSPQFRPWVMAIALPLWAAASFILASVVINALLRILIAAGVSFSGFNPAIFNTLAAVTVYALTLLIAVQLPKVLFKGAHTTRKDVGLHRLPTWSDILVTPVGYVVYFTLTAILTSVAMSFSGFDINQVQETGFSGITQQYEYILAFFALVILAPFAEEVLFRGYLFGKLKKYIPVWVAVFLTSLLFGLAHLGSSLQWNVVVDTFALSIVLCTLREFTGSLWPSILLHALKNGLAYYLLFINPTILNTL